MPLFVKTSGTSNSSTWPKAVSISVKTAISTWVKAKSAFVRTAAGWIQFFPKSGPYTTTFPYFSSTTTGLTPISELTLDTGSTVYLQKGTWVPNGFTISSYSYYVYTTSNGNINTTTSQFNAVSGTLTQYATIPLSAATYDGYYIYGEIDANTTTTGVTGIETTDGNGSRYFVCRKYIPTQAAYTPAINYSYNSSTSATTLLYTNKWNGTADYLPDSTRSAVLWYSSTVGTYTSASQIVANATYVSSTTPSISNDGTLYTVTASTTLSPATVGRYYYAVEYEYNSKSDWNVYQYGSQSPSAYAVYGPIITQPAAFTYSLVDTSGNRGPTTLPIVTSSVSNNTLYLDWSGTKDADQYREYLNSGPVAYTGYYPGGATSTFTSDFWGFSSSGTESITFYAYNTLNGQIGVAIQASSNTDYYQVYYRVGNGAFTLSANITGNIYFINAPIGTPVTVVSVVAYNNAGGSTPGTLNPLSPTSPITPTTKSTSVTKTFNLTYVVPTYTVTWNANGGTVSPASSTVTAGTSVTAPTPTRSGYTMGGWWDAASGGNLIVSSGSTYTPSSNVTLYAHWTPIITVTWNANGGTVSPASSTVTAGTSVTAPTPTRSGYTMGGWWDAASGGNLIVSSGFSYTPGADITLYAHWTVSNAAPSGGSVSVSPTSGAVGSQFSAVPSGWSGTPSTFTYTYSWQHQTSFSSWVQDGTGSTFTPTTVYPNGYRLAWTVSNGITPNATGTTGFTVTASGPFFPPFFPPFFQPSFGPFFPPTFGPPYFPPPYFSDNWGSPSDYRLKENIIDHEDEE